MKIRQGFVSNSSSSSFIVKKALLNDVQMTFIRKHDVLGPLVDETMGERSGWDVTENKDHFLCVTSMDNFDLATHLICLGVPVAAMREADNDHFSEERNFGGEEYLCYCSSCVEHRRKAKHENA